MANGIGNGASRTEGYVKYFNTVGPCDPGLHYMLSAVERLPDARPYIDFGFYFLVHAPRQTGKTTALLELAKRLRDEGRYVALTITCETAAEFGDDVAAVEDMLLSEIRDAAELNRLAPELLPPQPWPDALAAKRLKAGLTAWVLQCPRPIVLFLDEIDLLSGEGLLAVLRQLRAGYTQQRKEFVHSVVLCGLRDLRDYKAASGGDPNRLRSGSPFNIKIESLRIGDFTKDEVTQLYQQHTDETGQKIDEAAIDLAYYYSQGQPWLVNALAWQITWKMKVRDTITIDHVERAKERLILARATHLDSLIDKLRDPRVRRVVEPILAGGIREEVPAFDDDVAYTRDLGLIAGGKQLRIANPIYLEVILRARSSEEFQPATSG